MAKNYNQDAIRTLLNEGLTDQGIRHLCYDLAPFQALYVRLDSESSQAQIVQWVMNQAQKETLFETLLAWIRETYPAPYEAFQPYEATPFWDKFLVLSHQQSDRALRAKQGPRERPGTFIPEIYVRRPAIEAELEAFLNGAPVGLFLVGGSGSGKTSLLCQWVLDLLAARHGVFFYDCAILTGSDIESSLRQDLALAATENLWSMFDQIEAAGQDKGKQFVLIFDALNEFQGHDQQDLKTLLKQLDALVGRLPGRHIRVVVSCNSATWRHLTRLGALTWLWDRYYRSQSGEIRLYLDTFTGQEFKRAYVNYQRFFNLQTPVEQLSASVQAHLRDPLLLRMLAEAYQDGEAISVHRVLALDVFERYYSNRIKSRGQETLLHHLAATILKERQSTLPVSLILPEHQEGEPPSKASEGFWQLLNRGVLSETSEGLVKFTYPRFAGYVLARYLLSVTQIDIQILTNLTRQASEFPLAWETARALLLLSKDSTVLNELARSIDINLRQLAVESLVALHADEPEVAIAQIQTLLKRKNAEEAQRTGLLAAYYIGAEAKVVFLKAAQKRLDLHPVMQSMLYLTWHTDPDFTYHLLDELVMQLSINAGLGLFKIFKFVLSLAITIYINHCDQETVKLRTAKLFHTLAVDKLSLRQLHTGFFGPLFEKDIIYRGVAKALSGPIWKAVLPPEMMPVDDFFQMPAEDKAHLKRVTSLIEPGTSLDGTAIDDLKRALTSEMRPFNIVAGIVLAVHACQQFEQTAPLLQHLFDTLAEKGKLWTLISLTVLIEKTPPDWIALLERFTRQLIEDHPAILYNRVESILDQIDILLLPLGLAYGKQGPAMPYFEELLQTSLAGHNIERLERIILGLGVVGFYYPQAILALLRKTFSKFDDRRLQPALVKALAFMRTLHMSEVDTFLHQIDGDEALLRQVSTIVEIDKVERYILWLGLYNNAVHQALFYPKMRRRLLMGGLNLLAEARDLAEVIEKYTRIGVDMTIEADFDLLQWTLDEG